MVSKDYKSALLIYAIEQSAASGDQQKALKGESCG
jgi:hypothetical protein